jgi:AcrR family transcriptional regulator
VPTGVAIRDARGQLFAAAERVLLRDGPGALTSRAVTAEAGVAKGVLHRHFADFDGFLAELIEDRIARLGPQAAALREAAGTGTVTDNLTGAVTSLLGSVAVAIIPLITFRDKLRARLRRDRPSGVPMLSEAVAMIADYLAAERDLGRIAADANPAMLAPTLLGAAHLLYADRDPGPPDPAAVRAILATVLVGVLPGPGGRLEETADQAEGLASGALVGSEGGAEVFRGSDRGQAGELPTYVGGGGALDQAAAGQQRHAVGGQRGDRGRWGGWGFGGGCELGAVAQGEDGAQRGG